MAQSGYTPILLYSSSTTTNAPAVGNLTNSASGSELAINITDGKLFYKDNANAIQVIGWKTTPTTAGGTGLTTYTAGDLSYYASGTTLTKLGIGTNGQVLTSTGTAPQWSTLSGVAVTTFSAGTTGFTPNSATSGAVTLAGTLITSNGGTGLSSYTAGDLSYYASGTTLTKLAIGASGRFLSSTGSAPQWSAPAALTEVDDTNVTMTLGGTPSTALLNSVSMTLGWTGTLAVGRGGTGASTFTAGRLLFGNTTSAINTDANIFWDNTNKRLGVGTSSPSYQLHVYNAGGNAQLGFNFGSANTGLIQGFSAGLSLEALGVGTYMVFSVAGSEAARIDAGNLLISQAGKYVRVKSASTNFDLKGNAGGNDYLSIDANGTQRHLFNDVGAAYNTTGTWGTISDARLKENINDATDKLADVLKLRVVNYNLKTDPDVKQIGFVAQEVEQVFPGLIDQIEPVESMEPTENGDFYKAIKTSVLLPILVKAMQEQQAQIDELKNQLTQLKGI
jgi:hypothetical protein